MASKVRNGDSHLTGLMAQNDKEYPHILMNNICTEIPKQAQGLISRSYRIVQSAICNSMFLEFRLRL